MYAYYVIKVYSTISGYQENSMTCDIHLFECSLVLYLSILEDIASPLIGKESLPDFALLSLLDLLL